MTRPIRFETSGTLVRDGAETEPFRMTISEPFPHPEFHWQCVIERPAFDEEPMRVYGFEKEFARCQALGFVETMLGHLGIKPLAEDGRALPVPKPDYAARGADGPVGDL